METPTGPPRPRQVTLAAWLIMLGSAFVVLTMFERIAGLHTLETQRSVEAFLSEPPGDGLGLGLQGIQDILHTLAMVAAGCAAAAAILGFQILQRSRLARVLLSVLAVPLFLAGLVSGGFLSSVVAAAVVMLWFQPSRDWFNGVTRESPPTALTSPAPPATTTGAVPPISAPPQQGGPVDPVQHPASGAPPAYPGFGSPPDPATSAKGAEVRALLAGQSAAREPRPAAVVRAVVTTWVFATLALVMTGASIVVLATNPDLVLGELSQTNKAALADAGISDAAFIRLVYLIGGLVMGWCLAAIVLASFVLRRISWARPALLVAASLSSSLSLLGVFNSALLVVPLIGSFATMWWLTRPEVRTWFRRS